MVRRTQGEREAVGLGARRDEGGGLALPITRRTLLQRAAGLGVAASTLSALDLVALMPDRAAAAKRKLPEVQFQIEKYLPPAFHSEGVNVRLGPVYTTFATFALTRVPTPADQEALARALAKIEAVYPFSPSGVFATVATASPTSNGCRVAWRDRSWRATCRGCDPILSATSSRRRSRPRPTCRRTTPK